MSFKIWLISRTLFISLCSLCVELFNSNEIKKRNNILRLHKDKKFQAHKQFKYVHSLTIISKEKSLLIQINVFNANKLCIYIISDT